MAAEPVDLEQARRLRAPILRWYRKAKRDLPWRRTADPYAIWVSEVMLQQTTVAAVIPYWERFLGRFPDAASLAKAREDDVLALWSGLGYYRRARALREGAIAVMESHGGEVPGDVDTLTGLPGVGRYTAGAIASLAFGRESAVVDGNVKRVFSRLFAIRGATAATEKTYWSIADTLVRGRSPGDWNQAVMELGATVCTPRAPRCGECPARASCRARALGTQEDFPARIARPKTRVVPVAVAWIERRGKVLLVRRRPEGVLRGAWDLPAAIIRPGESAGKAVTRELREEFGLRIRAGSVRAVAKHAILATRLSIEVVEAFPRIDIPRRADLRWERPDGLDDTPISGATKKIVRAVRSTVRRNRDRSEFP